MSAGPKATRGDLARTAGVALLARIVVLAIAWNRFPPADDGVLYDVLARRLAAGLGYTWAWRDGAVTAVAHYPVGYPALLAIAYRLFGEHPASAIALHALVGVVGAVGVHAVAGWGTSRPAARWAGIVVALHPALLTYTPAIMTEGLCSALLAVPFTLALIAAGVRARSLTAAAALLAGAALGGVALVRPQVLLLFPLVAWLAMPAGRRARFLAPALVSLGLMATLVPWLVRNERAFGRPVLVSANSGWNLLIGTDPAANGTWRQLEPPLECREVWGEADKDACFGAVARRRIRENPLSWLALVPQKLAATFDLGGTGGSYLSRSRPDLVSRAFVLGLGAVETLFERVALAVALGALALEPGKRRGTRRLLGLIGALALLTPFAWVAYAALAAVLLLAGTRLLVAEPLRAVAGGVLVATIATHGVFFGAGRYALLVYPWVAALACTAGFGVRAGWRGRARFSRSASPALRDRSAEPERNLHDRLATR